MYISKKRGDSLLMECTDDTGDITGTTIEAAVKHGGFYQALTVTETDLSVGQYSLSAETGTWPIGSMDCDIKYTVGDDVTRTETFQIIISSEVTA